VRILLFVGVIHAATRCAHRIIGPAFVTIAKRPSWPSRDGRKYAGDLPDETSDFFFTEDMDRLSQNAPSGKSG
jgi:hypothetical protein